MLSLICFSTRRTGSRNIWIICIGSAGRLRQVCPETENMMCWEGMRGRHWFCWRLISWPETAGIFIGPGRPGTACWMRRRDFHGGWDGGIRFCKFRLPVLPMGPAGWCLLWRSWDIIQERWNITRRHTRHTSSRNIITMRKPGTGRIFADQEARRIMGIRRIRWHGAMAGEALQWRDGWRRSMRKGIWRRRWARRQSLFGKRKGRLSWGRRIACVMETAEMQRCIMECGMRRGRKCWKG